MAWFRRSADLMSDGPAGLVGFRPRSVHALAMSLLILIAMVTTTGLIDWSHYSAILGWEAIGRLRWQHRLVLWSILWCKTWLLLTPIIALALGLLAAGWTRSAWSALLAGLIAVLTWVVVDVETHQVTGNHMLTYVMMAGNGGGAGAGDLLRGSWPALWRAMRITALVAALLGGGAWAAMVVAMRWVMWGGGGSEKSMGTLSRRRLGSPLAGAVAVMTMTAAPLVGLAWAPRSLTQPLVLERLAAELPMGMPFLEPAVPLSDALSLQRQRMTEALQPAYERVHAIVRKGQAADDTVHQPRADAPNVIIIVLESLRYDVLNEEVMPRLNAHAQRGLRFDRHYSDANSSQAGIFAMLFGRSPVLYDAVLDAGVLPQLTLTMRQAGYRNTYIHSGNLDWERMDEYIDRRSFDEVIGMEPPGWPERDIEAMNVIKELADGESSQRHFIFAFLMSTHHPYEYPGHSGGYEHFTPAATSKQVMDGVSVHQREPVFNRYKNSARFSDDIIGELIDSIDLTRNLVIVTGDHGESMWEDGVLAHWSKLSDIQTRVPLMMVGAGVPNQVVTRPTTHVDLMPTVLRMVTGKSVSVAHAQGRDLLGEIESSHRPRLDEWSTDANQAVVAQVRYRRGPREMLVIDGDERLMLKLWVDQPRLRVMGFYDERGAVRPDFTATAEREKRWIEIIEAQLSRLAK